MVHVHIVIHILNKTFNISGQYWFAHFQNVFGVRVVFSLAFHLIVDRNASKVSRPLWPYMSVSSSSVFTDYCGQCVPLPGHDECAVDNGCYMGSSRRTEDVPRAPAKVRCWSQVYVPPVDTAWYSGWEHCDRGASIQAGDPMHKLHTVKRQSSE